MDEWTNSRQFRLGDCQISGAGDCPTCDERVSMPGGEVCDPVPVVILTPVSALCLRVSANTLRRCIIAGESMAIRQTTNI